jgi:hypothetical protein
MLQDNDKLLQNPKIITCIVPSGTGRDLVDAVFHELNINAANVNRGRGASGRHGGGFADEMEIVTVVVEPERADEVFGFLHDKAEIGEKRHRFMYQASLSLATAFTLPDAIEEESD